MLEGKKVSLGLTDSNEGVAGTIVAQDLTGILIESYTTIFYPWHRITYILPE